MDPSVSYGSLPVLQECFLLGKGSELSSAKGILLNLIDAPFDLPIVPRCTYSCRYKRDLVVLTEFGQLRVEFGVIIVGRLHGTLGVSHPEAICTYREVELGDKSELSVISNAKRKMLHRMLGGA